MKRGGGGGAAFFYHNTLIASKSKPTSHMSQTWRASKWIQAASDGSFSSGAGGYPERGGDSSGHGDHWTGGHDNVLPSTPQNLVVGWGDVVHAQSREIGEFLDGISTVVVEGGY